MPKKKPQIVTNEDDSCLIHITLATGNGYTQEAMFMMMYNGIGFAFPYGEEDPYVDLNEAISWNRNESKHCTGDQSHFHLRLANELSEIPKKEDWKMSDELLRLLTIIHPEQAKKLYMKYKGKSGKKGLSDRAKNIIESTLKN